MLLAVTSSPHIRDPLSTPRIMARVLLALLPAAAAAVWQFGPRAAMMMLVGISSALAAEGLVSFILPGHFTLSDGSAAVTGLLLAMTLSASAPYWLCALGAAFAVVCVKALFGGLGQNIFNPALAGRAFLLLCFPRYMVHYTVPDAALPLGSSAADVATAPTPLHHMVMPALPPESLMDVFLGRIGGSIGEVSALALLLGGGYLLLRGVISWHIPAAFLATLALGSAALHLTDAPLTWALYNLCSGGALLGAFFMATDYVTSPVTRRGQLIYGAGCGALTLLFRRTGIYPGGVTYAILLMNGCVWTLDRLTQPRRFGVASKKGDRR
ncbi:MAG: RnfABCDGE type electron transport complex subunit D [Oscillospiraceae bacterium]|nr:RnfABCDGE type electron transport complex subunit D [Oscillospiraceae bacterium]